MGSKHLLTKESQRVRFSEEAESRVTLLTEKGLDAKKIARDSILKRLKARIKQVKAAVTRITFLEEQKQKLLERKEQRKAEAEAARIEERASGKKSKKKEKVEPVKPAAGGKKGQAKAKAAGAGGDKGGAKKKGK
jgi:hypothetical protein